MILVIRLRSNSTRKKNSLKDIECQTRQYQNHWQTRSDINKKQHCGSNIVISHYQEKLWPSIPTKRVPGNNSYRDTVWYDKRTLIILTTLVKGLIMKELNKYLTNSFGKLRSFPGVKIKQLSYYAVPWFVDETQNRTLIHRECNAISDETSTQKKTVTEVLEMAKTCRGYGVNDVFIS